MANLGGHCPIISPIKYNCKLCNYTTSYKKDYNKHLSTNKHTRLTNAKYANDSVLKTPKFHKCKCGKEFKHTSSLCKHKKSCTYMNENNVIAIGNDIHTTYIVEKKEEDMPDMKELIIALMTQNQNMQKQMFEQQAQAQVQAQAQDKHKHRH